MSLNDTPSSNRIQIGFFGLTNAGKSSLVNAITNQTMSLVSPIEGTTTDTVKKAMELLPLGPVVIIDTPGLDDATTLGQQREKLATDYISKVDLAVLVTDGTKDLSKKEKDLLHSFESERIPYLIAYSKCDLFTADSKLKDNEVLVSATSNIGIHRLKEMLANLKPTQTTKFSLLPSLIQPLDLVILVVPVDSGAPKDRLILPQQQVIRQLLELGAITITVRETELKAVLEQYTPKVVITDSQAFHIVKEIVPKDIYLTSFSILFARYKGNLRQAIEGAKILDQLENGAHILITEGCSHHRQCEDIGTVKLPKWIQEYTGKQFHFEFASGQTFPDDLSFFDYIIHCGGCMLPPKEMQSRLQKCKKQQIPVTNYGILISHIRGILEQSIEVFQQEY